MANPQFREQFQALASESIYLSVLTLGELKKGIETHTHHAADRDSNR